MKGSEIRSPNMSGSENRGWEISAPGINDSGIHRCWVMMMMMMVVVMVVMVMVMVMVVVMVMLMLMAMVMTWCHCYMARDPAINLFATCRAPPAKREQALGMAGAGARVHGGTAPWLAIAFCKLTFQC